MGCAAQLPLHRQLRPLINPLSASWEVPGIGNEVPGSHLPKPQASRLELRQVGVCCCSLSGLVGSQPLSKKGFRRRLQTPIMWLPGGRLAAQCVCLRVPAVTLDCDAPVAGHRSGPRVSAVASNCDDAAAGHRSAGPRVSAVTPDCDDAAAGHRSAGPRVSAVSLNCDVAAAGSRSGLCVPGSLCQPQCCPLRTKVQGIHLHMSSRLCRASLQWLPCLVRCTR